MGVTSKGLRYPEATVLANTLHTRIKELADDVNAGLVTRDGRLDALDTKTNTTDSTLAQRGVLISRSGNWKAADTNLPNNATVYTTNYVSNPLIVPANSRTMVLSMALAARCETNAQCHWQPAVHFPGMGWSGLFASTSYATVHNQGQPAINMGFSITTAYDVRSYVGQYMSLAVNAHNDTGSGAWIHVSYLHWSASFYS